MLNRSNMSVIFNETSFQYFSNHLLPVLDIFLSHEGTPKISSYIYVYPINKSTRLNHKNVRTFLGLWLLKYRTNILMQYLPFTDSKYNIIHHIYENINQLYENIYQKKYWSNLKTFPSDHKTSFNQQIQRNYLIFQFKFPDSN